MGKHLGRTSCIFLEMRLNSVTDKLTKPENLLKLSDLVSPESVCDENKCHGLMKTGPHMKLVVTINLLQLIYTPFSIARISH